jgi:hypothetical protein
VVKDKLWRINLSLQNSLVYLQGCLSWPVLK